MEHEQIAADQLEVRIGDPSKLGGTDCDIYLCESMNVRNIGNRAVLVQLYGVTKYNDKRLADEDLRFVIDNTTTAVSA